MSGATNSVEHGKTRRAREAVLFNDAVGLFAVVGPTMSIPVFDRLREAHADASEADLVDVERRA